jgi:hypothetical protein
VNSFCRAVSNLTRASCAAARAQVVVLGHDPALPEQRCTGKKGLLKLVGQSRCQVFALGVGDFTAFDDRHHLVSLDRVAEPLAQLDDRAKQPHRDSGDAIPARCDQAGHEAAAA